MNWPSNEAILGLLALVFLISLGAMFVIGNWQLRDRSKSGPDST